MPKPMTAPDTMLPAPPHAEPYVIGVRHHSPACARLVAERIEALRPRFVLIEGPADFNGRLDELRLPHRLPVAIFSYLSAPRAQRGSWTPFCEYSPEWVALQGAAKAGAQACFIDLPAWHDALSDLSNRYADADDHHHAERAAAYEAALCEALAIDGRDALWEHLFEGGMPLPALAEALDTHFSQLRGDDPGSVANAERETMMARWIAWAMGQARGAPVLVVCGGYHAPALRALWRGHADAAGGEPPAVPMPEVDAEDAADEAAAEDALPVRCGSYLVPYTSKRLDAFAGYASGMPSPMYQSWVWRHGSAEAGKLALAQTLHRLREKKLPASTADLKALHSHAHGLALLRGHAQPLRCDWLDASAATLIKDALDAPLPWTYRGPLLRGTDPVLVELMDVLAGDQVGLLAAGTPQPPLVASVEAELAAHGIVLEPGRPLQLRLDLLQAADRQRSRVLHRLRILALPGVSRERGAPLALSGEREEHWRLLGSLEQRAALIEAGAYGATLHDAARTRLEEGLRGAAGKLAALAVLLNDAAFAGLPEAGAASLAELGEAVAAASRFEELGEALALLHALLRHGQMLGMAGAPVLRTAVAAAVERALWLLDLPGQVASAEQQAHLMTFRAVRDVVRDARNGAFDESPGHGQAAGQPPLLDPQRALAVWRRKARDPQAAPASRGAALGALASLDEPAHGEAALQDAAGDSSNGALRLLAGLPPASIGDALAGLLALARDVLAHAGVFVGGLDGLLQQLDDEAFVQALPAMRMAFAWLPPAERGALARQVLALRGAEAYGERALTAPLGAHDAVDLAAARLLEAAVAARLRYWGVPVGTPADLNPESAAP
ncbi:DUF5682 family protein [Cupriavidus basilensis]|uniref:DUF5682 family protein n=1 Tax=Cupriavidus basilensis TaxID=68895 RepID=A0ABT6ARH7_9BURK|nr:DUF5682 family protein [Cupriavidus basilensis]MDF3835231.1 DUF5682 family protein [Cupriavidus basilensis]